MGAGGSWGREEGAAGRREDSRVSSCPSIEKVFIRDAAAFHPFHNAILTALLEPLHHLLFPSTRGQRGENDYGHITPRKLREPMNAKLEKFSSTMIRKVVDKATAEALYKLEEDRSGPEER